VWRPEQLVRERERLDRALEQSHAELAERVTQLEQLCRLLEDQAEVIDQDLQRAELIQRALLPSAAPRLPGFCIDALYRPGRHVGGDLYDIVNLDERYTVLVIADASGHGVSAAMLSVLFKHRLEMSNADSGAPIRPPDALAAVNQALLADVPTPGVFVSAVYALLDKQTQEISLSSAGHPPVWWIRADHAPRAVERCGPALGLTRDVDYAETTLSLCSGDMLLFYTDGLLDDTKLDPKQVAEWYFGGGEDGYAVTHRLYEAARESSPGEDRDDITILLLQVREEQGRFDHAVDPERAPRATPTGVKLSCGECAEYTFFRIEGRGTWTDSQDFYEVARGVAESGRSLSIDLQDCVYLDSTFLGTIHELVTASVAAGGEPALQGIRPELRRLFEELCMDAVLAHADAPERSAPVGLAPLERSADDLRRQQRVLRAHETLSSLSASNREQLEQVVQSLRAELRHGR
jgi:sigma-B regulation protein RsbU (phosphoserine phosphatase)